jgi:hypothetical protein
MPKKAAFAAFFHAILYPGLCSIRMQLRRVSLREFEGLFIVVDQGIRPLATSRRPLDCNGESHSGVLSNGQVRTDAGSDAASIARTAAGADVRLFDTAPGAATPCRHNCSRT